LTLIQDEVMEFLSKVPPFQFLDERALWTSAKSASLEFYPKGTAILTEGGEPSRYLYVIKKGGVKVYIYSEGREEIVKDYRGECDSFGFISLIGEDKARSNVVAVDDTICYLVPRETVLKLMDMSPAFKEYYLKSFLIKSIDRTYKEMHNRSLMYGGGDKLMFTTTVGEIVTKKPVSESQDICIKDAAEVMSGHNISSLILMDENGFPAGILTDKDLRTKVVARSRSVFGPVKDIMSRSLVRVESKDYCFEALLKMIRYGIHHVIVVENGLFKGVVTNHDFLLLQGTSPVSVVRDIESRFTVDDLTAASGKVTRIISLLLKEGARAGNLTHIITEINDRLVRQVIEITLRKIGPAPLPFCWIALGSEGRKEQTFKTDQDNAVIYADPGSKSEEELARRYFADFTAEVEEALSKCGFPACPAGYMASNPMWRQPLRAWKDYFRKWIHNPTPDAVLNSLIFFDFRPVYGDFALAETLRDAEMAMIEDQGVFLGFMANTIIKNRPPIGFIKTFVVEKGGEHKDELDLKIKGLSPIIDAVRLFALEKGVKETSTLERIAALKDVHTIVGEYAEELGHAFEFIMLLRIHHQLDELELGLKPDNFINPDKLSGLEKKTAKEAFHVASKMQDMIIERYKPMIW
jgi:CBS domain-containing protein